MLELVRSAGFADVQAFSVSPSADSPEEICPLAGWDAWLAPAFLVTAARSESSAPLLLQRIVLALDETQTDASRTEPGKILRVINSARGKSIALVQQAEVRVVVRMARSAVMREDEAQSYEVLRQIGSNPIVAEQVPRPLGAGVVGGISYFAQSHIDGVPLSTKISSSNRASYLLKVDRFLRALNPKLTESPVVSFDDPIIAPSIRLMSAFALSHVSDDALRARSGALLADCLRGATSRLGIVHGDLGLGNILVDDARITGVIDWEAARALGPPVLDALNYLDSAHRGCNRSMSIVDTLPMLASGDWPIPGEMDFLKEFFRYCGVDFRFRKGIALLYALFHFGPQLRFADVEQGPKQRLATVLSRLVES